MFDEYFKLLSCPHLWLLLIVIIKPNRIFALPNPATTNGNDQLAHAKVLPPVSDNDWTHIRMNRGKDQLNAHHLRNTRRSIMKSVFIIVGGVFILITVGGIVSIIVYCIKKK
jgi:hypothetical protein